MKHKIIILMLAILLITPIISAEPSYIFPRGKNITLCLPVFNSDNSEADASTNCYLTLKDSEMNLLLEDLSLYINGTGNFCIDINDSFNSLGEYPTSTRCDNGADFAFSSFTIEITQSGREKIGGGEGLSLFGSVIVMLMIGIFFFLISFKFESTTGKIICVGLAGMIFIIAILFSLVVLNQTFGGFSTLTEGYATFWFVIRIIIIVVLIFFTLYCFLLAFKLWKIKRGLIDID